MATVQDLVDRLAREDPRYWPRSTQGRENEDPLVSKEESTSKPTRKITAAGIAGALTTLLIWIGTFYGIDMHPEAAASLTALLTVAAGYIIRES